MDCSPSDPASRNAQAGGWRAPDRSLPPFDLAEWLRGQGDNQVRPGSRRGAAEHAGREPEPALGSSEPSARNCPPGISRRSRGVRVNQRLERARAYLAKIPPAIAGQRGHDRTFHAACVLIQGFSLSIDEARPLLDEWNLRCVPPWTRAELEHKLNDAARADSNQQRGYLWGDGPDSARRGTLDQATDGGRTSSLSRSLPEPGCPLGQEANPHRLAQLFVSSLFVRTGEVAIRFWRDEFHVWDGVAYRPVPASEIRAQLTRSIAEEFSRLYRLALAERGSSEGMSGEPAAVGGPAGMGQTRGDGTQRKLHRPIPVTGRLVSDVLQALASLVLVSTREVPAQPAWLAELPWAITGDSSGGRETARAGTNAGDSPQRPRSSSLPNWPPEQILPARNLLVHLPSLITNAACTAAPTARFFNAFALEYDFDPSAPPPENWLGFLAQIWEDDTESIACLQEWFGYLLTPDTCQQKILMMVGPKRSGRGTIARRAQGTGGGQQRGQSNPGDPVSAIWTLKPDRQADRRFPGCPAFQPSRQCGDCRVLAIN